MIRKFYILSNFFLTLAATHRRFTLESVAVCTDFPTQFFVSFFNSYKKMIEILSKICVKITIFVVENREPYYFIIICKCKEVPLSLFSYQMLDSTLTTNEWSVYYKIYVTVFWQVIGSNFWYTSWKGSILQTNFFFLKIFTCLKKILIHICLGWLFSESEKF